MNSSAVEQLIRARLSQAKESLEEADTLFRSNLLRGTINRAYYAMFYSVLALSILKQKTTSKHSGVISFFDRVFVKTGIFSKDLSKSLHLAFHKRQENDYGEVFSVTEEEALQILQEAHTFIESIEDYMNVKRD